MADYQDLWYLGHDGLRLYARDYPGSAGAPLLCMHGLTRNSVDFEDLCCSFAGRRRIIAVDQRGRGKSDYDTDSANYNPTIYVQDMFALINHLGLSEVVLVGTSMGGIMAMMMAVMQPTMVRAIIMNDIGPEVSAPGLARIQSYVGKSESVQSWTDAVAQTRAINEVAFPLLSEKDWLAFARRLYVEDERGTPVLAYDPAISDPVNESQGESLSLDLWPTFEAISDKPLLVIRGELSDILAPECVEKMQSINTAMQCVEVANTGHAPLLSEPEVVDAVAIFLQGLS